jgi:hypothetical protein
LSLSLSFRAWCCGVVLFSGVDLGWVYRGFCISGFEMFDFSSSDRISIQTNMLTMPSAMPPTQTHNPHHSQTFPNKSSLVPPNPPLGLLPTPPALVATGLAWLQPPNSSSACTLYPPAFDGLVCEACGATVGLVISPQPESNGVCIAGGGAGLNVFAVLGCAAGCAGGSGAAQASLEPHASVLFRLAKFEACGKGGEVGCGFGGWEERLKALLEE